MTPLYDGAATAGPGSAVDASLTDWAETLREDFVHLRVSAEASACTWVGCSIATTAERGLSRPEAPHVTLQTWRGHYVVAEGGGGGEVNANRTSARQWETFELIDVDGLALRSGDAVRFRAANGDYLVAEHGGGGAVNANRTAGGPWETFTIEAIGMPVGALIYEGDEIALRTYRGQYVVAEEGGGDVVNANRSRVGAWETFVLGQATY